ncbi:hypothetical protein C2845_PM13G09780 [Panicum miliaceum]|uniref:Uncharacterized protein n=1 Tax=Panicum miliaceum TaxID=4540 RepID=A0A3L6RNK0_PANMI|nr:hypothetical protein C2845_PM13G09780 [Panicum miliaceum]
MNQQMNCGSHSTRLALINKKLTKLIKYRRQLSISPQNGRCQFMHLQKPNTLKLPDVPNQAIRTDDTHASMYLLPANPPGPSLTAAVAAPQPRRNM